MTIRNRRERDKDRMRRRILDAAKQLFVREGYDNVSMRRFAT
jgi:AcrR family transcriptional regulator